MTHRTLTIHFLAASHHGSGFGRGGLIDRTILRDADGMPYLAGSALKGRFRHAVLRILLSMGKPACQYGDQKAICKGDDPCATCRLFGSPYRAGTLIFSDARLNSSTARIFEEIHRGLKDSHFAGDSFVRSSTAIDRALGTVRPHLLFTTEALPPDLVFESEILGDAAPHEELLHQACLVLTHFGADGARGLGRCEYKLGESK